MDTRRLVRHSGPMTTRGYGRTAAVGLALFLATTVGCGGDGGGGSCGTFTPCGGDVVGSWSASDFCFSGSPFDIECPGATVDASGLTFMGTLALNADMTYSEQGTAGGSMVMTFSPACFMEEGITPTCAQLDAGLAFSAADPESPFSAASCTTAGSNCRCSFTMRPTAINEAGTYMTSGSVITSTSADGTADVNDYCVSGNRLQLRFPAMSMGMMGMVDMGGTITYTKR